MDECEALALNLFPVAGVVSVRLEQDENRSGVHSTVTAGHVTHQPIAVLESGSVHRRLTLTELGATGSPLSAALTSTAMIWSNVKTGTLDLDGLVQRREDMSDGHAAQIILAAP